MSALPHPHEHRAAGLARRCREELGTVAEAPLWSLTAGEAGDTLVLLTQARAQLDELLMRVLRHAETVETALAAGEIRTDQAGVIVTAVDALPVDVEDWVPPAATEFLLGHAAEYDAKALRVLGRRLLEVIDPVAADAEEARRLAREEAHARAIASFTMTDDGNGTCYGRFTLPSPHGTMLRKNLLARAAATRTDHDGCRGGRFSRHQLGLAFMDYIETRPDDTTPTAGGVAATVVVTMDLETLTGGLKAASTPAANAGSTPRPNASSWVCAIEAAPPHAATHLPPSLTPTTTKHPGPVAAAPASRRAASSAPDTTPSSTTQPSNTRSTNTAR